MNQKIKLLAGIALIIVLFSCIRKPEDQEKLISTAKEKTNSSTNLKEINTLLDSFNVAAAESNFDKYFSYLTEDAIYIGTDATENWTKKTYMQWAKPYFDAKTTWNFKSVQRNVYFGAQEDIAWFDELLNTQMKICRGSGVVIKKDNKWKIQQYVLSMTIPNSQINKVIAVKSAEEDSLLNNIKK